MSWTALGHSFRVSTPSSALDDHLSELLADLPPSTGRAAHHYEITGPDHTGRWTLLRDGRPVDEPGDRAHALALLLWRINRGVVEDTADLVLLHAGGVVVDGVAVLLPGDMEVGKTTLVTGLLRRGLGYLSDEAVGIDLEHGSAHGYGKALSLDPGSWWLFPELEPQVPGPVQPFLPHQWQVRASSIPGVEVVRRAPIGAVVLPRYRAGAPCEVRRLGGAEALLHLAGCVFPTSIQRGRIVECLARLLDEAPCYEVAYGDLASGVDSVLALVGDGDRAAAPPVASMPGPTGSTATGGRARGTRVDRGQRVARRDDARLIGVADDWVIHVAGTDELHRIDALGAALWRHLDGRLTVHELIAGLASSSAQEADAIAATLVPFIGDLIELDLVR